MALITALYGLFSLRANCLLSHFFWRNTFFSTFFFAHAGSLCVNPHPKNAKDVVHYNIVWCCWAAIKHSQEIPTSYKNKCWMFVGVNNGRSLSWLEMANKYAQRPEQLPFLNYTKETILPLKGGESVRGIVGEGKRGGTNPLFPVIATEFPVTDCNSS